MRSASVGAVLQSMDVTTVIQQSTVVQKSRYLIVNIDDKGGRSLSVLFSEKKKNSKQKSEKDWEGNTIFQNS